MFWTRAKIKGTKFARYGCAKIIGTKKVIKNNDKKGEKIEK